MTPIKLEDNSKITPGANDAVHVLYTSFTHVNIKPLHSHVTGGNINDTIVLNE